MSADLSARLLVYAELLYGRAVEYVQEERFVRAAPLAAAAGSVARFVSYDPETPDHVRERATALGGASKELSTEIWKAMTEGYGDRHLSGSKAPRKEEEGFWKDVDELARTASRFLDR